MSKFWVTIIVLLVIVGGVWWAKGGQVNLPSLNSSASPSAVANASKTPAAKTVVKKTATPAPTPSLSYTQLVQNYGSNRIQFDRNCQAQPKTVVFKNGTRVLLDNRSNQTETIVIDGISHTLGAYGYEEVTLSSSGVPKTLQLSCNSLVNVGTIQLEANISGQ